MSDDKTRNNLIDMLIEVLHGENSDTRDLAVVQLVLFGNRSVSPLLTYLEKEEKMHFNLESEAIQKGAFSSDPKHCSAWIDFREKWGHFPDEYANGAIGSARRNAIQSALKALKLLGVEGAIDGFPRLGSWLQGKTYFADRWP